MGVFGQSGYWNSLAGGGKMKIGDPIESSADNLNFIKIYETTTYLSRTI